MRTVSLISDSATPCGVETFQRHVATHLAALRSAANDARAHDTCAIVGQPGEAAVLDRLLADKDTLLVSLPVVAWKRHTLAPLRAMALARRRRKAVVLVLHEWADLDWKRRALYRAYVPFATRLLFSSRLVQAQFDADRVAYIAARARGLVPIPPNVERPQILPETAIASELRRIRASGKLLIAQFGAIYPKKQPGALLDIVADLKRRGHAVHGVFVGSFIGNATIDIRAEFEAQVRALDLQHNVTVTGYIGPSAEVFAALDVCDVLVYRFEEGLSARRGSVLAALQTGKPVLVNGPRDAAEFAHHPAFRSALADGALHLLSPGAQTMEFSETILTIATSRRQRSGVDFARAWHDAVEAIVAPAADTA